jgi:cell division ATPase FtsA
MAKNETGETEDVEEAAEEVAEAESLTEDRVKHLIAEALESFTGIDVDSDDEEGEHATPSKGLSVKDIEEATRRAVEEAMKPLRAAKKAAPAKKAASKPDPEPQPVEPKRKSWTERLWGTE